MTGQTNQMQVLRDCLSVIEDIPNLVTRNQISQKQAAALFRLTNDYLDELLAPIYAMIEKENQPLMRAAVSR